MALDTSKPNQKVKIPAGTVLFEEGSECNSLNILHDGALSFLKTNGNGKTTEIFSLAGANLTPGAIALLSGENYPYTIQTQKESLISTYSMTSDSAGKTIASKQSLGIMVAKSLIRESAEYYKRLTNLQKAYGQIKKTNDNLTLLYYAMNPNVFPDIEKGKPVPESETEIIDPLIRRTRENLSLFFDQGGILPEKPSAEFLDYDHSTALETEYPEDYQLDDKEFLFLRKLMSVNPKILAALFTADPSLLVYTCEKLSETQKDLSEFSEARTRELRKEFQDFFGGTESLVEKFYLVLDLLKTGYSAFAKQDVVPMLASVAQKIERYHAAYKTLFAENYANLSPNAKKFLEEAKAAYQDFADSAPEGESISVGSGGSADAAQIRSELENSANVIFQYAQLEAEKVKELSTLMIKLKQLKNPLDAEPDIRKLRRNITKIFWDLYKTSFTKYLQAGKTAPKQVELMLKFGFFDESLLDDEQLSYIYNFQESPPGDSIVPVWMGTEWLEKIYAREIPTSIDELGQTFFEKVKHEHREENFKKESDLPATIDNSDSRLNYELTAMYEANVRLTTGSLANYLPIITKYHFQMSPDRTVVTREKLRKAIDEILEVDFSAFNREVIFNNEELGIRKEFIQRRIIPDFVLVPSVGTKVMMWQELSIYRGSGSKESRGRIMVPMFLNGDLKTALLAAIAAFRWELCKTIMGADWNNVGIPSITADYTDYIQFFKKNKDLSIELKEKLASEFKRFRSDRDIFANDYQIWTKFEAEGVQRLNKVSRGILYRHCPFSKAIRDKLSQLPAYADIHNRFVNIRNRKYTELENRYKKYINQLGSLPPQLQENLDFYKI